MIDIFYLMSSFFVGWSFSYSILSFKRLSELSI